MTQFEYGPQVGFGQAAMSQSRRDLVERADRAQSEMVTGRLAQPADALEGRSFAALTLGQRISQLERYREAASLAELRGNAAYASLETIRDALAEVAAAGRTAMSAKTVTSMAALGDTARGALEQIVAALNVSAAGRPLFAGNAASRPFGSATEMLAAAAVAYGTGPDIATSVTAVANQIFAAGGTLETALYQGGSAPASAVEVGEGLRISIESLATDPAFKDILRLAASVALVAEETDAASLDDAFVAIEQLIGEVGAAETPLIMLMAEQGQSLARVTMAAAINERLALDAADALDQRIGRDQAEAAAELTELQAAIELLYTSYARLSRLSLASYLR